MKVLIVGEPGIGRERLAELFAARHIVMVIADHSNLPVEEPEGDRIHSLKVAIDSRKLEILQEQTPQKNSNKPFYWKFISPKR